MIRQAGVESARAEVPCAGSATIPPPACSATASEVIRSLIVNTLSSGPEWNVPSTKASFPVTIVMSRTHQLG